MEKEEGVRKKELEDEEKMKVQEIEKKVRRK